MVTRSHRFALPVLLAAAMLCSMLFVVPRLRHGAKAPTFATAWEPAAPAAMRSGLFGPLTIAGGHNTRVDLDQPPAAAAQPHSWPALRLCHRFARHHTEAHVSGSATRAPPPDPENTSEARIFTFHL